MATQPIDTAKVYALTSAGACSVTLTQGGKTITWEALPDGGQTSFIVPAGATAELSNPEALLSPLPANFKAALGTGTVRSEGECLSSAILSGTDTAVTMHHAAWRALPAPACRCRVTPAPTEGRVLTMQLMVSPAADLQLASGWLTAADGAQIIWLYRGEPDMGSASFTYIITLVQISPAQILANLSAVLPRS